MSNMCFIVRSFVFLMECQLSEQFFTMNTADSNVTDMNIHHTTECFSSFSVTFIEDRFCHCRTWSFTLSKNDLDPNDNSNSVSSSPKMKCCGLAPLWGQTTGIPVLSSVSSSSKKQKRAWSSHERNLIGTRVSLPKRRQRVSPFYHPSIHQLSTLEKTKLCHRPTLSSVLSTSFKQIVCGGAVTRDLRHGRQRVAPFYHGFESCFQGLQQSDPINRERESCPISIQCPTRWFLILLNCEKQQFVSWTSNLLEQMCGFQKHIMFLQKWILNLQDLPQSQSPETVPICIA